MHKIKFYIKKEEFWEKTLDLIHLRLQSTLDI